MRGRSALVNEDILDDGGISLREAQSVLHQKNREEEEEEDRAGLETFDQMTTRIRSKTQPYTSAKFRRC